MNEFKKQEYHIRKRISSIFFALMIIASLSVTIVPVSAEISSQEEKFPEQTPLQTALMEYLDNSKISIMRTSDDRFNPSNIEFSTEVLEKSENHVKLKGTTIIEFNNPMEAGNVDNKWPALQISENPELIGEGTVMPGEYDQLMKENVLSQINEIEDDAERAAVLLAWKMYDFESGPRKQTITEYYEITYPEEPQSVISYAATSGASTNTNDVLMGFTYQAPKIDWIIEDEQSVRFCLGWPINKCWEYNLYYYKAGVEFNASVGLRLPTEVTINHPDKMYEPELYTLSSSINGVDWNADQYIAANVPPENGNEFVARIKVFAGVIVEIAQVNLLDWAIDIDKDYGKSFETPFGPDVEFPIPDLFLSPDVTQLNWDFNGSDFNLGIGLTIDPNIGSETINADWSTNGDAIGSGTVDYSYPNVPYNFGPVTADAAGAPSDYAEIQLSDFEYHFDKCNFDLYANIIFEFYSMELNVPIPLMNIDASDITGGLYLGVHDDTTADTADASILVIPTADLSITKTDSTDPVIEGEPFNYTVTVDNNGPSEAVNVQVTDTLPGTMTFISTSGCTEDPYGVPTCTLGTIPACGSASYTIMVTGDSWGMKTNTAVVSSDTYDLDLSDNIATEDTYVVVPNQPGIKLSISEISLSADRNEISGSLVIQNDAKVVPSMVIETIDFSIFNKVPKHFGGTSKFEPVNIQSCTIMPEEPPFIFEGSFGETKTVWFSCTLTTSSTPVIPPHSVVKVTPGVKIFNRDKIFHHSISQDFP
jgi:uncharacterized repeat protein (TIGR01451 family)